MKKAFIYFLKGIGVILGIVLLYFVVAVGGSLIPVNLDQPEDKNYKIYVQTNGVHTDIVVPKNSEIMNWGSFVDSRHTRTGKEDFDWVAFGWGDLDFYQNTPHWSDLTIDTAFRSLFMNTPAAMHVKYENYIPDNDHTISIDLNRQQYEKLAVYIKNSFLFDSEGNTIHIEDLHYSNNDAFYRAKGSLNLFNTCNTWTNRGLKEADLKASLWTPFSEGIFYRYD